MSYTSPYYLFLFLGAVFIAYTVMPEKYKWSVLLCGSYVFYWINSGRLALFLISATAVIYFTGLALNRINDGFNAKKKTLTKEEKKAVKAVVARHKKAVAAAALILLFGMLLVLKYTPFFVSMLKPIVKIPKIKFILPLGISYYTLQAAGYVIDVYRGKYKASRNFFKVALFLSFFPQIVEGPIGRFDLLADPLYEGHRFDYRQSAFALQRIAYGMLKKMVIADRLNAAVAEVFGNYGNYSGSVILFAGVLYTIQIYAEFSGCMDIVIGSAQLFGVPMSENFNQPFFSKSVNEFWRRWHITLGAWLKEYVFYSVSLSKPFMRLSKFTKNHFNEFLGSLVPASFALFFTWFGIGFWHGAGIKYIVYGLYYYAIMMVGMYSEPLIVKGFSALKVNRGNRVLNALRVLRTLIFVVFGMMLFRADTAAEWGGMVKSVFTDFGISSLWGGTLLKLNIDIKDYAVVAAGVILMLVIGIMKEKGISVREKIAEQCLPLRWTIYLLLILATIIFGAYGNGYGKVDFIYGQF